MRPATSCSPCLTMASERNGNVVADDAATDGLPATFTGAAGTVARVADGEEKAGTDGEEDTLLHREALLVVTTSDTEDVARPFRPKTVALDLLREALVIECAAGRVGVQMRNTQ